jgi:hypothetical protein
MTMKCENRMATTVLNGSSGWLFCGIALSACGGLNATSDGAPGSKVDAAVGAIDGPAKTVCDPLGRFGPWVSLGSDLQNGLLDIYGQPTADELSFYFHGRVTGSGNLNLYVSRRATRNAMFGAPTLLSAQSSAASDVNPSISADGLTLWFESDRPPGTIGVATIYVATRANLLADFGAAGAASGINASGNTGQPFLTADNTELWFSSDRSDPSVRLGEIWSAKAGSPSFLDPKLQVSLNSENSDWVPRLSADGLTVYLSSDRLGGQGSFDIWRATRNAVTDSFSAPLVVTELNTAGADYVGGISSDNCRIYGQSQGTFSVATRQP